MSFLMTFGEEFKAIRPTDNTLLSMPTRTGDIEVYLLVAKFGAGVSSLVAVPKNHTNLTVLGLSDIKPSVLAPGEWIIPPFQIQRNAFARGGPFIRSGKIAPIDIDDAQNTTYLVDYPVTFRPNLAAFIPNRSDADIALNADTDSIDRSDWNLVIWISGAAVRKATGKERTRRLVPWTDHALGSLDLWLERYRCHFLGRPLPTTLSPPDENIDFDTADVKVTDNGLKTKLIRLDAFTGDNAGDYYLWIEVIVNSPLDHTITATGHQASGHFLAALATYHSSYHETKAPPRPDPEGQGTSFSGDYHTIAALRTTLTTLTDNTKELIELIADADAQNFDFED